jgi:predicted DNA-binding protein YlxM (UPF0122 family)
MATETTYDKIKRLQQQLDRIDDQIVLKRNRMGQMKGIYRSELERDLETLLERHEEVNREIITLKGLSINFKRQKV